MHTFWQVSLMLFLKVSIFIISYGHVDGVIHVHSLSLNYLIPCAITVFKFAALLSEQVAHFPIFLKRLRWPAEQISWDRDKVSNFCQQLCTLRKHNKYGLFWTFHFQQIFETGQCCFNKHSKPCPHYTNSLEGNHTKSFQYQEWMNFRNS